MVENVSVIFDPETAFYLLKHFISADERITEYVLRNTSFTKQQINLQLAIIGSKIFTAFAANPLELYERIKPRILLNDLYRRRTDQNKVVTLVYDKNEYPDGIGYDGICPYSELSETEKSMLKYKHRDNNQVKVIHRKPLPTWHLNVVLSKTQPGNLKIKTIFPGSIAPPVPQINVQSEAEYKISSRFWDEHVFIEY